MSAGSWDAMVSAELQRAAVLDYCAHDMSLTGAEGPARDLGRPVVLWSCDWCGATLLQLPDG